MIYVASVAVMVGVDRVDGRETDAEQSQHLPECARGILLVLLTEVQL
jgi:hypothetical protein